jgi:hypothetical protein
MDPVVCCPNVMTLPVRMNTNAARIRALGHSRKYLAKLCVSIFEASRVLPYLDQIAPHCALERVHYLRQSTAMQNTEQVGFESSGASLTIDF